VAHRRLRVLGRRVRLPSLNIYISKLRKEKKKQTNKTLILNQPTRAQHPLTLTSRRARPPCSQPAAAPCYRRRPLLLFPPPISLSQPALSLSLLSSPCFSRFQAAGRRASQAAQPRPRAPLPDRAKRATPPGSPSRDPARRPAAQRTTPCNPRASSRPKPGTDQAAKIRSARDRSSSRVKEHLVIRQRRSYRGQTRSLPLLPQNHLSPDLGLPRFTTCSPLRLRPWLILIRTRNMVPISFRS
jgi:hypothetical protein